MQKEIHSTYLTGTGKIALQIYKHTDGERVFYSYIGKYGAGSGHPLPHVEKTIACMLMAHKKITLATIMTTTPSSKITVAISPEIANRLSNSLAPSHRGLGDCMTDAAAERRATLRGLTTISASRGQRITGTSVPSNLVHKIKADEARAWAHSDLAGVLWEQGLRASRAIAWARSQEWAAHTTLSVEPITSTWGVTRWEIQTTAKQPLAAADPADKGSLHRILTDAGYKPSATTADVWTK